MPLLSVEPNPRITYKVHHRDDDLLVIEKPARVPTQPGKGHAEDTLLNGLFAAFGNQLQNLGKARDFGLLHRLDKDTSGLLVVALRAGAYDALREAFMRRSVKKFYWAVCAKAPKSSTGVIRLPIAETPGGRDTPKLAHVVHGRGGGGDAKPAVTAYRVLQTTPAGTLVEARAVTGRLHQVRIHLDAIGCTIMGDPFYGRRTRPDRGGPTPRLALHAHRVVFTHPVTGEPLDIRTGWPADLRRLLKRVGLARPDLVGPTRGVEEPDGEDEPALS